MSSDFSFLKQELQKGAKAFKAFEKGIEVADKLIALEQSAEGLANTVSSLQKQHDEEHEALTIVKAEVKTAKAEAVQVKASAKAKAENVEALAHTRATEAENDAVDAVGQLKARAETLDKEIQDAHAELALAKSELASLNTQLEDIRSHLKGI